MERVKILLCIVLTSMMSQVTLAQLPLKMGQKVSYYIDVNSVSPSKLYEMRNNILSLQYQDQIGYSKSLPLRFYNWKKEMLGAFDLAKQFGLNHLDVDLTSLNLDDTQTYSCDLTDENGKKYEWYVKLVKKNLVPVKANITVNPLSLTCKKGDQSLVQFYGVVTEGRPPYELKWYVVNEGQTDFLYQPSTEEMKTSGESSVVEVDKDPSYYVILDVTDACGAVDRKIVFMQCNLRKRGKNSVMAQPLEVLPNLIKKIR